MNNLLNSRAFVINCEPLRRTEKLCRRLLNALRIRRSGVQLPPGALEFPRFPAGLGGGRLGLLGAPDQSVSKTCPEKRASSAAAPDSIWRTAERRSSSDTTLYRSKTLRVRCPDSFITTDSGTPRRRALVTKLLRRSWNQMASRPTSLQARRNIFRISHQRSPVAGLVKTCSA